MEPSVPTICTWDKAESFDASLDAEGFRDAFEPFGPKVSKKNMDSLRTWAGRPADNVGADVDRAV